MRLNSPNDLVMSKMESSTLILHCFFNLETFEFIDSELRELDFNGVYKYDPKTNQTTIVSQNIDAPNGLVLSVDEKFLCE